jgi:hypothetical protein
MSFNSITARPESGFVDVVIDGHEDWDEATACITQMVEAAEAHGLNRILIDFRRAEMRISPSEGREIGEFFNSFAMTAFDIAVILPGDSREAAPARAFCEAITERGHRATPLADRQARDIWVEGGSRRTGAA